MSARLDLRLLGEFQAEINGRTAPSEAWRQRRSAASLVKLLALSPRNSLTRDDPLGTAQDRVTVPARGCAEAGTG
jgi:hypothetical protein